jgi:hypothetical protein
VSGVKGEDVLDQPPGGVGRRMGGAGRGSPRRPPPSPGHLRVPPATRRPQPAGSGLPLPPGAGRSPERYSRTGVDDSRGTEASRREAWTPLREPSPHCPHDPSVRAGADRPGAGAGSAGTPSSRWRSRPSPWAPPAATTAPPPRPNPRDRAGPSRAAPPRMRPSPRASPLPPGPPLRAPRLPRPPRPPAAVRGAARPRS